MGAVCPGSRWSSSVKLAPRAACLSRLPGILQRTPTSIRWVCLLACARAASPLVARVPSRRTAWHLNQPSSVLHAPLPAGVSQRVSGSPRAPAPCTVRPQRQHRRGASSPAFSFCAGCFAIDPASRHPCSPRRYGVYLDHIISVAATRWDSSLASFSNWGASSVHLAAPGTSIWSTWFDGDNNYTPLSGGLG